MQHNNTTIYNSYANTCLAPSVGVSAEEISYSYHLHNCRPTLDTPFEVFVCVYEQGGYNIIAIASVEQKEREGSR